MAKSQKNNVIKITLIVTNLLLAAALLLVIIFTLIAPNACQRNRVNLPDYYNDFTFNLKIRLDSYTVNGNSRYFVCDETTDELENEIKKQISAAETTFYDDFLLVTIVRKDGNSVFGIQRLGEKSAYEITNFTYYFVGENDKLIPFLLPGHLLSESVTAPTYYGGSNENVLTSQKSYAEWKEFYKSLNRASNFEFDDANERISLECIDRNTGASYKLKLQFNGAGKITIIQK